MSKLDEDAFKREILFAFDYFYNEDDWVFPLRDALDGVIVDEVLWKHDPANLEQTSL